MKSLSLEPAASQAGGRPPRCHSLRFCTLGAAAGVLLSTMFASGTLDKARAQDAPSWRADTILSTKTYVDPASHDTLTKTTRTIAYNDVREAGWQEYLVERLTRWGRRLDAQGREKMLLGNLKIGTLPETVFQAARNLGMPDSVIVGLRASVSLANGRRH